MEGWKEETEINGGEDREMSAGRKKSLTKQDLLSAIREYAITSPSVLAKKLNISRITVWRVMQEISEEEINAVFKELAESELKPYQMKYEEFCQIPEVVQYTQALERREVSEKYRDHLHRTIWHLCVHLKRHPAKLTIEECANTIVELRKKKVKGLPVRSTRMAVRSWFENKGISGELLTSKGVHGDLSKGFGKRRGERLTHEQRIAIVNALEYILDSNPDFADLQPYRDRIIALPYFLYYTGTRIRASLKALIENIDKSRPDQWKMKVVDKGKHKKGRMEWLKFVRGELKVILETAIGDRTEGKIFEGLVYHRLLELFHEAYKLANIPKKYHSYVFHIWRHTAAQDLLDATDWNYDVVASILGWGGKTGDVKALKAGYGAMSETVKERALRKAMGEPVEFELPEFRF